MMGKIMWVLAADIIFNKDGLMFYAAQPIICGFGAMH